ncbi:hypothetical protein [Mesorhizobium japonicum]|uniref:hypothetical protein n=1 Tax=Mesorhizobium japonicum TaxID=2066070 RepID=UPI003B5A9538
MTNETAQSILSAFTDSPGDARRQVAPLLVDMAKFLHGSTARPLGATSLGLPFVSEGTGGWSIGQYSMTRDQADSLRREINRLRPGVSAELISPFEYFLLAGDRGLISELVESARTWSASETLRGTLLDDLAIFVDVVQGGWTPSTRVRAKTGPH